MTNSLAEMLQTETRHFFKTDLLHRKYIQHVHEQVTNYSLNQFE
jgi:hypothetical protein